MKYLDVDHVLRIHERVIEKFGGTGGVRDRGLLESAVAQPRATFDGKPLYPTLAEKAGSLGYSLNKNDAFHDGNKRASYGATRMFLMRNGYDFAAPLDERERVTLSVAAGEMDREQFTDWIRSHMVRRT